MSYTKEEQAEHRKIWVAALRSGKHRQVSGSLRKESGFCCLGLACEVSDLGTWNSHFSGEYMVGTNVTNYVLNDPVKDWLGLASVAGDFGDGTHHLASLNDSGKTFAEIADIIESEPEGLVVK